MGGGVSSNRLMDALTHEASKPLDLTNLSDLECRQELIALRSKLKDALNVYHQHQGPLDIPQAVSNFLKRAEEVECTITPFLQNIAESCGGRLEGLEHRFKSKESLERKIRAKLKTLEKQSYIHASTTGSGEAANILDSIADALRYTVIIPFEHYCEVTLNTRKKLQEQGHTFVKLKNYWADGDMYQGINDEYRNDRFDFVFEVQYHTPESFELKSFSHKLYEEFRVCEDPETQKQLFAEGTKIASELKIPEGVQDIPMLMVNPEPDVLDAYSYLIESSSNHMCKPLKDWLLKMVSSHTNEKDLSTCCTIEVRSSM
jgi:hypothetical protein